MGEGDSMSDLDNINDELAKLDDSLGSSNEPVIEPAQSFTESIPDEQPDELSEIEKNAIAQGWKKEGVVKDGAVIKKSAEEFIRDGEYIKQLMEVRGAYRNLSDENKQLKGGLDYLIEQTKKRDQIAYEKAMTNLNRQRLQAVENSDTATFQQAEHEIQQLYQQNLAQNQPSVQSQQEEVKKAVDNFLVRNQSWYNDSDDNEALVALAEKLDKKYFQSIPNHDERLRKVEAEVKQKFSTHTVFRNSLRDSPSAVSNTSGNRTSATGGDKKLSAQQKTVFDFIKATDPKYTIDQYFADIG